MEELTLVIMNHTIELQLIHQSLKEEVEQLNEDIHVHLDGDLEAKCATTKEKTKLLNNQITKATQKFLTMEEEFTNAK